MSQKKDISDAVRNNLCNSCGACAGVCSRSAIGFRESVGGYFLPYIDYGECNGCGLCFTCCPGIHFGKELALAMPSNPFQGAFLDTWVGKAEDQAIYRNSQSGGVVSALLSDSLHRGDIKSAAVVTMKMAKKPRPEVILVRTREEIMNAQKSKYCPVPVLSIIKKIEDSDSPVAIVGLPCHIHGLFNVMAVNKGLSGKVKYTIGLICDRVMTYAGADFLVRKSGVDPDIDKLLEFRDKSYSGYPGHVKVMGKDEKPVFMPSEKRTQLKDFFTPARCRLCFDKMNIFSDITIGDPHGVSGVDRKSGESLVIARTERGLAVIKKAIEDQSVSLRRITYKEAADGQAINKKMSDWRSYSEAWKELGFDLPDFYDTVKQNIIFSRSPNYLRDLKFLLALNDFGSRDELFKVVDGLLKKRRLVKHLTYPARVLFTVAGKIKKKYRRAGPIMKNSIGNRRKAVMVEIRGVGFVNKGAELMLYAILQKLGESCKNVNFAMLPPSSDYQYIKRAKLGLYQKIWLRRYGTQWGNLLSCFIPEKAKKMYGLVTDSEIDIVLDASGFAYGDYFRAATTEEMAGYVSKWKRDGKKIVLLPQAFGPFETFRIKRAFKVIAQKADLIFARDRISYQYIADAVGSLPNIFMAPDFTNLLKGEAPDYFSPDKYKVCIVPNCRMIDKVPNEKGKTYLPFLIKCCNYLAERDAKPFILIHEGDRDYALAQKIRDNTDNKIEIIRESDPLYIKGILGKCEAVISSRFHALVSALSQGIPSLATSWSHKYQMLFDDYDCGECMISLEAGDENIKEKIGLIIDETSRSFLKNKIEKAAEIQKKRTDEMWDKVIKVLSVED